MLLKHHGREAQRRGSCLECPNRYQFQIHPAGDLKSQRFGSLRFQLWFPPLILNRFRGDFGCDLVGALRYVCCDCKLLRLRFRALGISDRCVPPCVVNVQGALQQWLVRGAQSEAPGWSWEPGTSHTQNHKTRTVSLGQKHGKSCEQQHFSGTKKQPKEYVFGPDIPRTSTRISRRQKLRSGPRNPGKTNILVPTSMTRRRGRPWPQGGLKNFGQKNFGLNFRSLIFNRTRQKHSGATFV